MVELISNISPLKCAFLAGIFTWLITALGSAVVFFFKKLNKKVLDGMLGFAAGVMIAASFWSLLEPGIELAEKMGMNEWLIASLGFVSGGILIFITDNFLRKINKISEGIKSTKNRCILLISAITIHNIPEGLAIGVAFGSIAHNIEGATMLSAIALAIGIGMQNFPEGAAISMPLRREGYTKLKAFMYGQLSAIVEPISSILGAILVLKVVYLLPFFLSLAAGAMIYVVVLELIPESQSNNDKDTMALFTMAGFILMMALDVGLG